MKIAKKIKMPSIAFLMFAATLIFIPSVSAQIVRRSVSTDGKTNVTYFNSAKPGEEDIYVVNLRKDQSYDFRVEWHGREAADTSQGLSGYSIIYSDGTKKHFNVQDGHIQAANTGDYKIIVSPRTKMTNYRYRITFINSNNFKEG